MTSEQATTWRVSSYSSSGGNNNCVEVGRASAGIMVRDTKDRKGPVLAFEPTDWHAFVAGLGH